MNTQKYHPLNRGSGASSFRGRRAPENCECGAFGSCARRLLSTNSFLPAPVPFTPSSTGLCYLKAPKFHCFIVLLRKERPLPHKRNMPQLLARLRLLLPLFIQLHLVVEITRICPHCWTTLKIRWTSKPTWTTQEWNKRFLETICLLEAEMICIRAEKHSLKSLYDEHRVGSEKRMRKKADILATIDNRFIGVISKTLSKLPIFCARETNALNLFSPTKV